MKPQVPWLAAGLLVLAAGAFAAWTTTHWLALVYAAIPAAALLIIGGLVWSRGPA